MTTDPKEDGAEGDTDTPACPAASEGREILTSGGHKMNLCACGIVGSWPFDPNSVQHGGPCYEEYASDAEKHTADKCIRVRHVVEVIASKTANATHPALLKGRRAMSNRNWRVWDYNYKLLGEVCADTLGEARKLARTTWPDQLAGDRLFDIVAGSMVRDPLVNIIRGAKP